MEKKPLFRTVGLTGGMGAGKSTLVDFIRTQGVPVFDYDATVHKLYENQPIADFVGQRIGLVPPVTRQMVSDSVIKFPAHLPVIVDVMTGLLDQALLDFKAGCPSPFFIIDAPMLFECGWDKICDFIIAIQCPIEIRKERVLKRPGMTQEKMDFFMSKQLSDADRLIRSHYIVHNTGTIEESQIKILDILEHISEFYNAEH